MLLSLVGKHENVRGVSLHHVERRWGGGVGMVVVGQPDLSAGMMTAWKIRCTWSACSAAQARALRGESADTTQ